MKIENISGEEGKIVEIDGDKVKVRLPFSSNCEKCRLCKKISDDLMEVEAVKKGNIKVGSSVKLYIPPKVIIVSSFMLYIFPLLFLVGGYFFGKIFDVYFGFGKEELFPALFAFLFLFSSFIIVHIFDKAKRKDKNFKVFAIPKE